jgi:hypothetical protein
VGACGNIGLRGEALGARCEGGLCPVSISLGDLQGYQADAHQRKAQRGPGD